LLGDQNYEKAPIPFCEKVYLSEKEPEILDRILDEDF
jgi:hypothetical protein